jgi:hypothetical protein
MSNVQAMRVAKVCLPTKMLCSIEGCGNKSHNGFALGLNQSSQIHFICAYCGAHVAHEEQTIDPTATLLDVDWNIEGPDLEKKFFEAADEWCRRSGRSLSKEEKRIMANVYMEKLDEGKF